MPNQTLSESLETFLNSATWLTDDEAALIAACRVMASTLDVQITAGELVPSLMSQFTMTVARLHKLKPKITTQSTDPLAALLNTDGPRQMTTLNDS